ncbi:MAG: peptidylprolyl isomerase [Muribaculaceae bacterium]|nr:peptidylprolyl isomerase [Muribaculaceae bacterium]
MKKLLISAGALALAAIAYAATAGNDPVLMTVNGKKVHKSEFEYLYHKNLQQQQQPQSIDDYLQMFINYKLKVADAEAARLDTTESFRNEFRSSCEELAAPYMIDSTVLNNLVNAAYEHLKENVNVSHIMVAPAENPAKNDSVVAMMEQLRADLLSGKADWAAMVEKYTVDRGTKNRAGLMGWLTPGAFPWSFEKAAYQTATGDISDVVNSGFGYHLVRVNDRRPAPGEVKASHILILTRGKDEAEQARAKVLIDSLYNVAASGADFAELAKKYSQDPGSGSRGGDLGWFGPGRMVAPFDSAAFAMADGTISKPFATSFGWHIIKREASRPIPTLDEARKTIEQQIGGDERRILPYRARLEQLTKAHKGKVLKSNVNKLANKLMKQGGWNATTVLTLENDATPVVQVDGKKFTMADMYKKLPIMTADNLNDIEQTLLTVANGLLDEQVVEAERLSMLEKNPDFRNLVNEYHDGILLFDISNQKVWDKATKDKEGLENFFATHRDNYKWEAPKFKGFIVFAKNDSVMQLAQQYCQNEATAMSNEDFVKNIKERFGKDIRVERVIAAKGDNPITDYLGFGGQKPIDPKKIRWNDYFAFREKIIAQPEEVVDVRADVTTEYQNYLEQEWIKELRNRYKVDVDQKVLKTVK